MLASKSKKIKIFKITRMLASRKFIIKMKKIILVLIVLLYSSIAICQNSKGFIHLFSGETIPVDNVQQESKTFSGSYFMVGEKKYKNEEVQFYKNERGFFGNIKELSFTGSSVFAERYVAGNINLFDKEFTSMQAPTIGAGGMMTGGLGVNSTVSYYYNKGEFGSLKKSNYKNLKVDLKDNLDSMVHLNKFKSVSQRETLLYILGGGIMAVGVGLLINNTTDVPEDVTPKLGGSFAVIGIGFGTIITNYLTTVNKHEHIEKAIKLYNQ